MHFLYVVGHEFLFIAECSVFELVMSIDFVIVDGSYDKPIC